ncbi:FAD/NAD(P)-binding domain-containing protein [Lindgomyces ingoldianus]|uniref:FAD/NAD(P)-binding domain-containing protein n=1 Tax=Lindgomyces ingoldianus TaxID=673940 RepID=A0ACB6QNN1_9PLEO|nr:FAD/NAD(P)-binding domain-containing protein [Lindgomyces ingoldianus]KAF2468598.1 FAD/NAD(P)-binding domain-containing protein [Lindgomyces ingoldianus]
MVVAVQQLRGTYDYVIVGAGSAGFVLAKTLSQNASFKNRFDFNQAPAYYPLISEYFRNFASRPDPKLGVFDEWAKVSGNSGLAWKSLLEDFKAASHYDFQQTDYEQFVNTTTYGDGPLEVSRTSGLTGFDAPFASALKSGLGVHEVDLTDGIGTGLDLGVANRPNVQMIPNAWVTKIGFSGKTSKNVTYTNTISNAKTTIAAKEIIVNAGAINSPKLPMLSGVGQKARLSELNIPLVADIPSIGTNLYDHTFPIVELEVSSDIKTGWQWEFNATGKNSVFDGINGTHYTSLPTDRPHILMKYSTVPLMSTPNVSLVTAWASLVQAEASGYVTLNSSDFRDDPFIYSNYYGSPADKKAVVWGYKKLREIMGSEELKSFVLKRGIPRQECSYSFHHPLGTVALGKALDSNWGLRGLKSIRLVDVSTFPSPPSCHPLADVYAVAHRAAKDIRRADKWLPVLRCTLHIRLDK